MKTKKFNDCKRGKEENGTVCSENDAQDKKKKKVKWSIIWNDKHIDTQRERK